MTPLLLTMALYSIPKYTISITMLLILLNNLVNLVNHRLLSSSVIVLVFIPAENSLSRWYCLSVRVYIQPIFFNGIFLSIILSLIIFLPTHEFNNDINDKSELRAMDKDKLQEQMDKWTSTLEVKETI